MTPVVSIVGGFYSVWHNVINSYQLYQARKQQKLQ
jgi:BASS family bile acid:Na+ symporter